MSAVALVGVALTLAACSSGGSSSSATTAPSKSGGGATHTAGDTIVIKNFAFSPSSLTVAAGATVTVTNKDQVTHTLTAAKGGFDTGAITPGQSKTFTAPNAAGSYSYICSIHQYMTGTLVVTG